MGGGGAGPALTGLWWQVLCCNFHSNEATKPGTLSPDDFVGVIDDILASLGRSSFVLMGKSWGGRNAVAYAAARPEAVSRLVLSAPAFGMEAADAATIRKLTMPTLLGWSEDVSRTIVAETFIAAFSKDPQQQIARTGYGHPGRHASRVHSKLRRRAVL